MENTTTTEIENNDHLADTVIDLFSTFCIQDNMYCVNAIKVQEVINIGHITPVHQQVKSYIVGIINLRGRIVTIIDLAEKLGLLKTKIKKTTGIFILDCDGEYVGLLVDKIGDVIRIDRDLITAAPGNIQGVSGKYFDGVYQADSKLIAILNPELVLTEEDN